MARGDDPRHHRLLGRQRITARFRAAATAPKIRSTALAEDVRVATDAPVDLSLAFISSGLTAATFFGVLWTVGGSLEFTLFGRHTELPGYLVIGVIVYSTIMTSLMLLMGRRMPGVIESKNQAEAEFRAAAEIMRGDHPETARRPRRRQMGAAAAARAS